MKTLKINHAAVWVFVVISQVTPALWYMAFSKSWMELNGLNEDQIQETMTASPYISAIITSIVFGYVIAWLYVKLNIQSVGDGIKTAVILWLPFSLLGHITLNLFTLQPYPLSWLDGGSDLIVYLTAGILFAGWKKYDEN